MTHFAISLGAWTGFTMIEGVDVGFDAADLKRRQIMGAGDAADVRPDALFDVWVDEGQAVFGAEDEMIKKGGIGISHSSACFPAVDQTPRQKLN